MPSIQRLLLTSAMACAIAMAGSVAQAQPLTTVTAIDILLEPDATMLQHSEANNARLRKVFPKGFALDASHRPHITMVQCFVRTADLEKLYAAVGKVSPEQMWPA